MIELHLRVAGTGLILLSLLHAAFPRRFGWRHDLAGVSLLNRQIFYVHTLFIAATVGFFGVLSFLLAGNLRGGDPIQVVLLAGFTLFWLLRLVIQLFVFDTRLWRGQPFNTAMHVLFTVIWCYLTAVYAAAWILVAR